MQHVYIKPDGSKVAVPMARFLERFQNTPLVVPVPRVGEHVALDGTTFKVINVLYTPQHDDLLVVIQLESLS
jgi:hypothetical protein